MDNEEILRLDVSLRRLKTNWAAFTVLCVLNQEPDAMPSRIAKIRGISAAALTPTMDQMEKKGLLARSRGQDRRRTYLEVTTQGKALYVQVMGKQIEHFQNP